MNCAAITPTATHGASSDGQPRPDRSARRARSAPAESIEHGQSSDGALATIQSRANRLRHSNQIQRQRFLDLHQILSKGC